MLTNDKYHTILDNCSQLTAFVKRSILRYRMDLRTITHIPKAHATVINAKTKYSPNLEDVRMFIPSTSLNDNLRCIKIL